jgi:c-di-GMP-binding flagellar brake protein YcgR
MTGSVTYRSPVEIACMLEEFFSEQVPIYADLGEVDGAQVFSSKVLWVEQDYSGFFVAYDADDAINSLLYKQSTIKFNTDSQKGRFVFFTHSPVDATWGGKPAVYFPLPQSMLKYHRAHERNAVPAGAGLRCTVTREKQGKLEMRVVDISTGGLGCLINSEAEPFAPGEILDHCQITQPGGRQFRVAMSVQYSIPTMLSNGTYAQRAGLRFVEPPPEIEALARQFSAQG